MSNATGSYPTDEESMMKAFDKLPILVRIALSNAHENWVPQPILTSYRRGTSEIDIIRMINEWNETERSDHFYRMDRLRERDIEYITPIRRRKK